MNKIIYIMILHIALFFSACQNAGKAHNCGKGCVKEATVLAFSECGGFADRNVSDIDMNTDNTYVEYNVVNSQRTIYLTQYNAPITCEDLDNLGMIAGWLAPVSIDIGSDSLQECYCLRDVKMKIVLDHAEPAYNIAFMYQFKGENDPEIAFTIDTEKNSTGIVSFPRSVEPWGL